MFESYRKFETTLAGRPLVVETGKMGTAVERLLPRALRRHGGAVQRHHVGPSRATGVDFFPAVGGL